MFVSRPCDRDLPHGSGGDSSQGGTTAQKKKAGRKGGKVGSKS